MRRAGFRRTYVDSSVWIAIFAKESRSDVLMSHLTVDDQLLMTAVWTRTELASALGIKARRGELTQSQASQMIKDFELWENAGLSLLAIHNEDFLLAADMCENIESKLRGGDALHLAVSHRCNATHLLTLDHDMQRYGHFLGMELIESNEKFTR